MEGTAFAMIALFLSLSLCVNCFCEVVSSLFFFQGKAKSKSVSVSSRSETLLFRTPIPFLVLHHLSLSLFLSLLFLSPIPSNPYPSITSFLAPLQPPASHHLILISLPILHPNTSIMSVDAENSQVCFLACLLLCDTLASRLPLIFQLENEKAVFHLSPHTFMFTFMFMHGGYPELTLIACHCRHLHPSPSFRATLVLTRSLRRLRRSFSSVVSSSMSWLSVRTPCRFYFYLSLFTDQAEGKKSMQAHRNMRKQK